MFEKVIENLLQSILGDYVEGLDAQTLKVGIWSGEAQVENLRLKPDALLKLGIPFLVKYSKLGLLNVNIPWKNLASAPLQASLNTLYIILEPQQQSKWKFGLTTSLEKLGAIEAFRQKIIDKIQVDDKKDGMKERILIRVIENMQINIQNIHVRIEDSVTSEQCSYGFVLNNLICNTVNSQGEEQFIDRTSEANKNSELVKQLSVKNFGFYWCANDPQPYNEIKMGQEIDKQNYLFLLNLTMKVIQPPKNNKTLPSFSFQLVLETLELALSKTQLQQVINLSEHMNLYFRKQALYQQEQQQVKPLSNETEQTLKAILLKVPLDKKFATFLDANDLREINAILDQTTFDILRPTLIIIFKEQQYQDLLNKAKLKKQQPTGFLGGLFGGKGKKKEGNLALTKEEEDEVLKFLEQNFEVDDSKNSDIILVNAVMKSGAISIVNPRKNGEQDILRIEFTELKCQMQKSKTLDLNIQLLDMSVMFWQSKKYHKFLINTSPVRDQPIFNFRLQIEESFDQSIQLETRSSKLHFHPNVLPVLLDFVDLELRTDNIKNIADEKFKELQSSAQNVIAQQAVQKSKKLLNINLSQFFIQLPITETQSWLFSPGEVIIKTDQKVGGLQQNSQLVYLIAIQNINFSHCQNQEMIESEIANQLQRKENLNLRVIENFTIQLEIICEEQLNLKASITDINLNINPKIYNQLINVSDCFTPQKTIQEYKQQSIIVPKQVDQADIKNKIVEAAQKIGPLYLRDGQLNQWKKYTCVLSGSYLYFYENPKELKPISSKWVKNSTIVNQGVDEFKMNVVRIKNNYYSFDLGISSQVKDWIEKLGSIKDENAIIDEFLQIEVKQEQEMKKSITLNLKCLQIKFRDSLDQLFLTAMTKQMQILVEIETEQLGLQLNLDGLEMIDHLRKYEDPKLQYFLKSRGQKDLIQVQFQKISRNSKNYKNKDMTVQLVFGQLECNLKSETIAMLLQFISNMPNSDEQQQQKKLSDEFLEAETQFALIDMEVLIQQISVTLVHEITKLRFAEIQFQQSNIKFQKYADHLIVGLSLGNLRLDDLSNYPNTLYLENQYQMIHPKQIIGIKDSKESLLNIQFVMLEPLSKKAQLCRDIIQVQGQISQILLNYSQQPILRLVDYSMKNLREPFLNPHSFVVDPFKIEYIGMIKNTVKIEQDPTLLLSDLDVQNFLSNPEKMRINILIDNPQIIIDCPESVHKLIVNLGQIGVTNSDVLSNGYWRQMYQIQIREMNVQAYDGIHFYLASNFDLRLDISLPNYLPFYKRQNPEKKVNEVIIIDSTMSPFILTINQNTMELINYIVYSINLNDYFDDYVLLNQGLSYQINMEQQKTIIKQIVEQKQWISDDFLKFNLKINNISLFLCKEVPLLRLSIVNKEIKFLMKKNTKKELILTISAFDGCVYVKQQNNFYSQRSIIGESEDIVIAGEEINNLEQLVKYCRQPIDESIKLELYLNPTVNKNIMKLFLTFERFLFILRLQQLLDVVDIFQAKPIPNNFKNQFQIWSDKVNSLVNNKYDIDESCPSDKQIVIQLDNVTIAIPNSQGTILSLTGKFNFIINLYDPLTVPQLLQLQIDQRLSQEDLELRNPKFIINFTIDQLQVYVTEKIQLIKDDSGVRQLIFPLNILLNWKQQLVLQQDANNFQDHSMINGALNKSNFRLAFSDILYLSQLVEEQLVILNGNDQPTIQIEQNQMQEYPIRRMDFVLDGLDLVILNDIEDHFQYLLNFKIHQCQLQIDLRPEFSALNTAIPIELNYFNSKIAQWEPFLEKTELQFLYYQNRQMKPESTQIVIQQNSNMNLNLSTQLFLNIHEAINVLQENRKNQKPKINKLGQQFSTYAFYNMLGLAVLCITQDNQYLIVEQGQVVQFDIKNAKMYNFIDIQIQGELQHEEINQWNIDRVLTKRVKAHNNSYLLQTKINEEFNQKLITISADIVLQNLTKHDLEIVLIQNQTKQEQKSIAHFDEKQINNKSLQTNQIIIPNSFMSFYMVKKQLLPSKSQILYFSYIKQHSNTTHEMWLSKDFVVVLKLIEDVQMKGRFILNIQPYLRIQNILPFPVNFRLIYGNQASEVMYLQTEEYFDEHRLYRDNRQLQLFINGYQPSLPFELQNTKNFRVYSSVVTLRGEEFQGSKGGKSEISLEYDISPHGVQSVLLTSTEFIRNQTNQNLLIFQGEKKNFNILGGQKNSQHPILLNNTYQEGEIVFSHRDSPQMLSITPASIKSVGLSQSEIFYRRNNIIYAVPLIVESNLLYRKQLVIKQVTIKYRFIIVNQCAEPLKLYSQFKEETLQPNQRQPLELCCGNQQQKQLDQLWIFKISLLDDYNWICSGPIDFSVLGQFNLSIRSQKYPSIRKFLQVDLNEQEGCIFGVISTIKDEQAPYKITNHSKIVKIAVPLIPCTLEENQECYFAKEQPMVPQTEVNLLIIPLMNTYSQQEYILKIDKICHAQFIKLLSKDQKKKIIIKQILKIEGYTRHAQYYDSNEEELHNYKEKKNPKTNDIFIKYKLDISLNHLCLSVIDNTLYANPSNPDYPSESLCINIMKTEALLLIDDQEKLEFQFRMQALQIDNTSKIYPTFPVILTLVPKNKNPNLPILNILLQMNMQAKNLQIIEKIILETNNMSIRVDDQFLDNTGKTINKILFNMESHINDNKALNWRVCALPEKKIPTYIGQIIILPILIEFSVSWGKRSNKEQKKDIFTQLIQGLGLQAVNIDEAEITLVGWRLDDCFDTFSGLLEKLIQAYKQCLIKQLPALIGSLNIIGNPTKLLKNVVSGLNDFVEKPLEGFTRGPIEGGLGVVSGTTSLVSHTIAGTFNSVKNIVGTVSGGLTKITMDDDYLQQRQIQNQTQAKNVGAGFTEGSISLAKGIAGGVFGFVSKPIQGASEKGAEGFMKGLWKGTTGLIIKPVAGALDVITKTSEGVKNQIGNTGQASMKRIRCMRAFYGSFGYYCEFDFEDAIGFEILKKAKKGTMSDQKFLKCHSFEKESKCYLVIISDQSILLYEKNNQIKLWIIKLSEVESITSSEAIIQIRNCRAKKSFQNNQMAYLQIKNQNLCKKLFENLKDAWEQQKQ